MPLAAFQVMSPNSKGSFTTRPTKMIVSSILDDKIEVFLCGKLDCGLNIVDSRCVYRVLRNPTLTTGGVHCRVDETLVTAKLPEDRSVCTRLRRTPETVGPVVSCF